MPTSPSTPSTASATIAAAAGRSARETICRVAAGAIAKKLLAREGIRVLGYVKQVGDVIADIADPTRRDARTGRSDPVRCPDPAAAERMIALIEEVRKDQDSIGGVCELVAVGVPPGLGEPVFDKLKADLAKALLSLPAVTGVRIRCRFRGRDDARQPEQRPFVPRNGRKIGTETNRHGGMLGGISQRRADRLPGRDQADQQPAAAAADRDARGRADGDRHQGPPRSVPAAAIRADGRGDDGAGAGRSLAAAQDDAGVVDRQSQHGGPGEAEPDAPSEGNRGPDRRHPRLVRRVPPIQLRTHRFEIGGPTGWVEAFRNLSCRRPSFSVLAAGEHAETSPACL